MGAMTVDPLALGWGAVPDSKLQMERGQVSLKVVGHVVTHFSQTDPSNAVLVLEVEQVVHVCCYVCLLGWLVSWLVLKAFNDIGEKREENEKRMRQVVESFIGQCFWRKTVHHLTRWPKTGVRNRPFAVVSIRSCPRLSK